MVIDLVTIKSDDGYTAEVPSIKGCESWSHEEDSAIQNAVELLRFYLKLNENNEIKIDRAGKNLSKTVYKLVFNKY
ncbi:MAG: hypothetical protein K9J12_06995 [Melioribacteraceae bacterium]|nr:hypothetical protein [Melioribacteraceae bacterium]MCF8263797.1 hypothetical protein [Melioribacteraceae bacterium]MCF8412116.1 hypothetical protein [Melioribacteraceae bacterium]